MAAKDMIAADVCLSVNVGAEEKKGWINMLAYLWFGWWVILSRYHCTVCNQEISSLIFWSLLSSPLRYPSLHAWNEHTDENCALLVYCAASSGNFLSTFRDNLSVPYFRVQESKIGSISCPKTSVRNYHYSLRNIAERRSSQVLPGGSLKSSSGRTVSSGTLLSFSTDKLRCHNIQF